MNGYLNNIAIALNQLKDMNIEALDADIVKSLCSDIDQAIARDIEKDKEIQTLKKLMSKWADKNLINKDISDFYPSKRIKFQNLTHSLRVSIIFDTDDFFLGYHKRLGAIYMNESSNGYQLLYEDQ
jgi:hypothetical protein